MGHSTCLFVFKKDGNMILLLSMVVSLALMGEPDTVELRTLPVQDYLPADTFIPPVRLAGLHLWISAPVARPVFTVMKIDGFDGSVGFGQYSIQHPDKFFSTLEGYDSIDIPHLYVTQQMMIGNTLRLVKGFYMLSGIQYGAQLGIMGNNWGMGTREGFIWHPSAIVSVMMWNQYFQSLSVYYPVVYPNLSGSGAAIKMPATPEVFSFGLQATFVVGQFIIGIGTSITPKPFKISGPYK